MYCPDKNGYQQKCMLCYALGLIKALLMSTHNICFHGEIRKKCQYFSVKKKAAYLEIQFQSFLLYCCIKLTFICTYCVQVLSDLKAIIQLHLGEV